MIFTVETVKWLASDAGSTVLERLAGENLSDANTLRLLTSLRRDHSQERASAVLELARLRIKAVDKFGADAHKMFFTREALEQASDPLIRKWRLPKPDGWYGDTLIDVCCGIGSDSVTFATLGYKVSGYDLDAVRVLMAQLNSEALGVAAHFEIADVTQLAFETHYGNAFYDPARRDEQGKRIFDVERYQPPLSLIRRFDATRTQAKLSPGVDLEQINPYFDGRTYLTFISVNGELKEACLTSDGIADLAGHLSPQEVLSAVLLTENSKLQWDKNDEAPILIIPPRQWLIEPDPALIRAGLVADAALKFNGSQLDESIAYFTTDEKPESPWVRAWRILDWMPFNGKKLQAYLRERNVGTVTVKKRGTAVTPDVLIPQLKLKGSESRTLVLTRYQGQQIVMVCEDYAQ